MSDFPDFTPRFAEFNGNPWRNVAALFGGIVSSNFFVTATTTLFRMDQTLVAL
jgi:hypothetical protein